jgi:hypothetical protein
MAGPRPDDKMDFGNGISGGGSSLVSRTPKGAFAHEGESVADAPPGVFLPDSGSVSDAPPGVFLTDD